MEYKGRRTELIENSESRDTQWRSIVICILSLRVADRARGKVEVRLDETAEAVY